MIREVKAMIKSFLIILILIVGVDLIVYSHYKNEVLFINSQIKIELLRNNFLEQDFINYIEEQGYKINIKMEENKIIYELEYDYCSTNKLIDCKKIIIKDTFDTKNK